MRVKSKIPFAMRNLALAAALATVGTQANAALVADGIVSAGEYSVVWQIGFQDDQGNLIGNGHLYFGQDATGQFLYFQMPLDYVDNTYGTNASAGWTGGHTFDELLKSDSMGAAPNFTWTDAATKTTNATRIDYLADCSGAVDGSCTTGLNSGYRSAGVGTGTGVVAGANGGGAKWTQMDVSLTGSAASILQIASSLEYDLNFVDKTATTNSSLNPLWVDEVGYEIQFKPGTFDAAKWANPDVQLANNQVTVPGLFTLGDPHVSPPKMTFGTYTSPCLGGTPGCGQVPEPGTTWLLAGGLAGMLWYSRRRREALRSGPIKLLQVPS